MLTFLTGNLGVVLAGLGALLVAGLGLFGLGRRAGRDLQREAQRADAAEAREAAGAARREAELTAGGLTPDEASEELRRQREAFLGRRGPKPSPPGRV